MLRSYDYFLRKFGNTDELVKTYYGQFDWFAGFEKIEQTDLNEEERLSLHLYNTHYCDRTNIFVSIWRKRDAKRGDDYILQCKDYQSMNLHLVHYMRQFYEDTFRKHPDKSNLEILRMIDGERKATAEKAKQLREARRFNRAKQTGSTN